MITIKTVNNAIKKLDGGVGTLVKGEGYFYFFPEKNENWDTHSVMVYKINDLTLERWLEEYEEFKEQGVEADKRISLFKNNS